MSTVEQLRRRILDVAALSGEGHVPSSLSVLDIVHTLYADVLKPDDVFILSKGHASLGLYAVLEERGILKEHLDSYCQRDSILGGHPDARKVWRVEASTGSLGHGLPIAVGIAMARPGDRVYCLVGDQECNEGSIWEAAMIAAHRKLSNLIVIVDFNRSGEDLCAVDSIGMKFAAFNWAAEQCSGHSAASLARWLDFKPRDYGDRPFCLVAHTIKGYGVLEMVGDPRAWHHRKITSADVNRFVGF